MASGTDSSSKSKLEHNFFAGTSTTLNWETYLLARPDYRESSFYDHVYSYHDSHSGKYDIAHDIGCGPGQVAAELASRFAQVHGSDPNEYIIKVAQRFFEQVKNLTFEVSRGEEIVSNDSTRAASADLVTVAECIPLLNTESAMSSFAQLVKPGGTLSIWFYGGPIYTSPDAGDDLIKEVQVLHRKITDRSMDEFRPMKGTSWEQAGIKISHWLDNVPFDPENWENVQRIKWNSDYPLSFLDHGPEDFDVASSASQVKENEIVKKIHDRSFWMKKNRGFQFARDSIDAGIPRVRDYITEEVKGLYAELEAKMEGKTWDIAFPVVLLLATKK